MPRQERAERTRDLLIQAAATSFDLAGFAVTGLNDITRLAGVSKGALYFHFGSKEQLAEAVMAESREGLRSVLRTARTADAPALQYLIDLCHGLAQRLDDDVVFRAGLRLTDEPGLGKHRCPGPHTSWVRLIRRQLSRGLAEQDIRPDVHLEEAATLLSAATTGLEMLSRRDRDWLDQQVLAGLWQAVLPSLVPPERLEHLHTSGAALLARPPLPGQGGPPAGDGPPRYSPLPPAPRTPPGRHADDSAPPTEPNTSRYHGA